MNVLWIATFLAAFGAYASAADDDAGAKKPPSSGSSSLEDLRRIEKLEKETTQKGMTLVVTRIYWKNGRIKFEIGVAKGKKLYDKRETEMRKTIEKETQAQLKEKLR
jgi:hypothetical protein